VALSPRLERDEYARWAADLDVRPANSARLPFGSFSGGNQQKLVLAKWLRLSPRVLLVDEPTQGVDVAAKARIHAELRAFVDGGGALVVASTDVGELVDLCSTVHVLRSGLVARTLSGDDVTEVRINDLSLGATVR
jgi:ribose transport system ATP-binding protein